MQTQMTEEDWALTLALFDAAPSSRGNRAAARARGVPPIIPRQAHSSERGRCFPKKLQKLRARVEQTVGKLKRFKRIAMRREKTDVSDDAFISFACGSILIESVDMA